MMGGDTDTIAAVTGAIAGARFGATALPDRWLQEINEIEQLAELAKQLISEEIIISPQIVDHVSGSFDL